MIRTSTIKAALITAGLYRLFRWAQDRYVRPDRGTILEERRRMLGQLLQPGELCFDIGSNIGDVTAALLACKAKVLAVDPQPIAMREIKARFGNRADLTYVESAVGSSLGEATLHLHETSGTSSLVDAWDAGKEKGAIAVPVTTLDALIATYGRPTYVKIDVEGYELEVLQGLSTAVPLISFEYHTGSIQALNSVHDCLNVLKPLGRLKFNLCPWKELTFLWSEWRDYDDFVREFPTCTEGLPQFKYGDIFVRIN